MDCNYTQPASAVPPRERYVYRIFWVLLLVLIAWPLAWFLAPIWIVLMPLEALFPPGECGTVQTMKDRTFRAISLTPPSRSSHPRLLTQCAK